MFVPSADRRAGVAAEHYFERRIRRIAGEIFVGIDVNASRMIDRQQLHLVEINRLFERLHKPEAELAISLADRVAIELNVFRWTSDVPFIRPDPVSDNARAQHVADELIVLAVPHKERGAGRAAPVDL